MDSAQRTAAPSSASKSASTSWLSSFSSSPTATAVEPTAAPQPTDASPPKCASASPPSTAWYAGLDLSGVAGAASAAASAAGSALASAGSATVGAASATGQALASAGSATVGATVGAASATGQALASAGSAAVSVTVSAATVTGQAALLAPGALLQAGQRLPGSIHHLATGTAQGLLHMQDPARVGHASPAAPALPAGPYPLTPQAHALAREAWGAHWCALLARPPMPQEALLALLPDAAALRSQWGATLLADAAHQLEEALDLTAEAIAWTSSGGSQLRFALEGVLAELQRGGEGVGGMEGPIAAALDCFRGQCAAQIGQLLAAQQQRQRDELRAVLGRSGLASFAAGLAASKVSGRVLAIATGGAAFYVSLGLSAGSALCAAGEAAAHFHELAVLAFAAFGQVVAYLASVPEGGAGEAALLAAQGRVQAQQSVMDAASALGKAAVGAQGTEYRTGGSTGSTGSAGAC